MISTRLLAVMFSGAVEGPFMIRFDATRRALSRFGAGLALVLLAIQLVSGQAEAQAPTAAGVWRQDGTQPGRPVTRRARLCRRVAPGPHADVAAREVGTASQLGSSRADPSPQGAGREAFGRGHPYPRARSLPCRGGYGRRPGVGR